MALQLPVQIDGGAWNSGHVQGIALDTAHGCLYYSFTTILVKTDLNGRVLGTVKGLLGHLGCIDFCEGDGRVYGTLEYKKDSIGKGILRRAGQSETDLEEAFYIAVFDGDKICRMEMDAETDGIMQAVYVNEVKKDYSAVLPDGTPHRYGCSGMDGLCFGPRFGFAGVPGERKYLHLAYGIYGDTGRSDNDCQVILRFDPETLSAYAKPLRQGRMHRSGPAAPDGKFFIYTGNTNWGVQNLEYDDDTGNYLLCVYPGQKQSFPNYPLYLFSGKEKPENREIPGTDERGMCVPLCRQGLYHEPSGIYGWNFPHGDTGIICLGGGAYYIAHPGKTPDGLDTCVVKKYRYTGLPPALLMCEEEG